MASSMASPVLMGSPAGASVRSQALAHWAGPGSQYGGPGAAGVTGVVMPGDAGQQGASPLLHVTMHSTAALLRKMEELSKVGGPMIARFQHLLL